MGLMFRRRRPLMRGAMLAGAGAAVYHAGKRSQANTQHEYDQDEQLAEVQSQQAPQYQAPPPPAAPSSNTVNELERLKALLDQGALTQAEFEAAKQQVLQGG